ncbi:NUDIX domain-containing protein [Candidatus Gracilibacteria bacterium]|nr:NUDIX domain-containing protein [Candidatus Gracilibacteria bacterium]
MARKYEKSSGGVVYRRRNGKTQILLLEWLNSRKKIELVIPKGKIEAGEVAKDTAVREISEEAGIPIDDLEIIKFVTKLSYTYTAGYLKDNPVIDKDVYLFIIKYNGTQTPVVRKEERFTGYKWVDIEKVKDLSIRFDLSGIIYRNKPFFI